MPPQEHRSPPPAAGPDAAAARRFDPPHLGRWEDSQQEQLARLHAEELIERLQLWASDLDAREAQLNARIALHEHRERHFRVWSQNQRAEWLETMRALDRQRRDLAREVRTLALSHLAGAETPVPSSEMPSGRGPSPCVPAGPAPGPPAPHLPAIQKSPALTGAVWGIIPNTTTGR